MNTKIKPSYFILGSAMMLSACAQEDISYSSLGEGNRIIFRTSLPGVSSRAQEIATKDLLYFYVTAFNPEDTKQLNQETGALSAYIDNDSITKNEGNEIYSSETCLWPEPGKDGNISFFAYYPLLNDGATLVNESNITDTDTIIDYKIKDFHVATDIADQVDFVTASATGSMAENLFSGITLNFEHQLSRIEVNAWGANKSCDIEIAGVRIGGVSVKGTFDFNPAEGSSPWSGQENGTVEHIFSQDEKLVILSSKNNSHATSDAAATIMGANLGDENNCAMLIPTVDGTGWKYGTDIHNGDQGMFISVLLRVIDKTPEGNDKQQYPYYDKSQGLHAMNIPRVVLAVDNDGKIKANFGQLYKGDNGTYYTDATKTTEYAYTVPEGCTVKEFGWAALPVTCNWEAGYVYTYTLDYSSGVGLHDPSVEDPADSTHGPKAGDPIISDRVGVSVSVNGWQGLNGKTTHTVEVPGS